MEGLRGIRVRRLRVTRLRGRFAAALCALLLLWAVPASAGELAIELNRAVDENGRCQASFLVRNGLGHTLDRFSLDLYLFDVGGRVASRILVDLAPVPDGRTTPFSFPLDRPCAGLGSILIAAAPSCRAQDGAGTLDCMAALSVSSRDRLKLEK